jgi:flagellar biosynthetic protein FliP
MLSEVERAFQIGFLIFLPFLVIDLVVAACPDVDGDDDGPPGYRLLPFKLAFFVVADGWTLITGALVEATFELHPSFSAGLEIK